MGKGSLRISLVAVRWAVGWAVRWAVGWAVRWAVRWAVGWAVLWTDMGASAPTTQNAPDLTHNWHIEWLQRIPHRVA